MIIPAIGAATSLTSSIYGAIKSRQQNNKANSLIAAQRDENKQWYEQKKNEDYTQRTDAQAVLKQQRDLLNEQFKRAKATQAVAGGSDESLALQQQAAGQSLGQTMTNMAGQAASYKNAAEQQYRQQDAALNQQQAQIAQKQADTIAKAAGQGVSAGLGLIGTQIGGETTQTPQQNASTIQGGIAGKPLSSQTGLPKAAPILDETEMDITRDIIKSMN